MSTFAPSEEQHNAIECPGHMVVVARPGSGKTTVVAHKVRSCLSQMRPHQGIVAISFTNKASVELERRCKADAFDVKRSFFGTIDDFCLREIIYPFARQVMTVDSGARTAKLRELPPGVAGILPQLPYHAATVADTAAFLPFLEAALLQGWIPLETVGMLACHVFDQSAACRRYFAARYRAIFIDEYQDSGYFQHELFLRLKVLGLTAVAVGDGDQSIYGFAHKDARYLLALTVQDSGFSSFAITTNFRSDASINEFALRLLNPRHPMTAAISHVGLKRVEGDQRAIGRWLNSAIPRFVGHYTLPGLERVAVLCRHQQSARLISDHLNMPFHLFEETPFVDAPSAESNLFADLLRLRLDAKLTVEELIERSGVRALSPQGKRELRQSISRCRTCADIDLAEAVKDAASRLLGCALSAAGEAALQSVCENAGLVQRFRTPGRDAVQVMTLHKAKGLEFDVVFHADLYDHVLPARSYPDGSYGQIVYQNEQQCLNLHYVGITRAIRACVLLTSTSRINTSGQVKQGAPSQFIGRNGTSPTEISW